MVGLFDASGAVHAELVEASILRRPTLV